MDDLSLNQTGFCALNMHKNYLFIQGLEGIGLSSGGLTKTF